MPTQERKPCSGCGPRAQDDVDQHRGGRADRLGLVPDASVCPGAIAPVRNRFRALSYVERGRCWLISRNGNVLRRFDALGDQLAVALRVDHGILDGEVIAANETGRPQFYDLIRRTRTPAYVAFDIVWLHSSDLRPLPLSERRKHLRADPERVLVAAPRDLRGRLHIGRREPLPAQPLKPTARILTNDKVISQYWPWWVG
jgi:hypothetical protein